MNIDRAKVRLGTAVVSHALVRTGVSTCTVSTTRRWNAAQSVRITSSCSAAAGLDIALAKSLLLNKDYLYEMVDKLYLNRSGNAQGVSTPGLNF